MSPVPPTDVGNEGNVGAATEHATTVPEVPSTPAAAESADGVPTPAPTKVDAYKPRAVRSKQSPLDIAPLLLRVLTAVFTLIAFAVIASDSASIDVLSIIFKWKFNNFFYFSYLLTVNVITFVYALVTILLSVALLSKSSISNAVFIVLFALDLILSYLLMSASTSAATGIRIDKPNYVDLCANSFCSKSYASIAFSFLAFFVLAAAALISGFRAARLRQAL